jgi:ribosome-associated protein
MSSRPRPAARRRPPAGLPPALSVAEAALADMKAVDVRVIDVRGANDVADFMVIASGTSDRHLRAIADRVVQMAKASGQRPLGVEGLEQGEWVLVDLPDVMVHVMLPRTREFYQLEQLWTPAQPVAAANSPKGGAKSKSGSRAAGGKPRKPGAPRKPGGAPRKPGAPRRSAAADGPRPGAARRRPPQGG